MCLSQAGYKNIALARDALRKQSPRAAGLWPTRDVGRQQAPARGSLTWRHTTRDIHHTHGANTGAALAPERERPVRTLARRARQRATPPPHAWRRHACSVAASTSVADALEDAAGAAAGDLVGRGAARRACPAGTRPVGTCHAQEGVSPSENNHPRRLAEATSRRRGRRADAALEPPSRRLDPARRR